MLGPNSNSLCSSKHSLKFFQIFMFIYFILIQVNSAAFLLNAHKLIQLLRTTSCILFRLFLVLHLNTMLCFTLFIWRVRTWRSLASVCNSMQLLKLPVTLILIPSPVKERIPGFYGQCTTKSFHSARQKETILLSYRMKDHFKTKSLLRCLDGDKIKQPRSHHSELDWAVVPPVLPATINIPIYHI